MELQLANGEVPLLRDPWAAGRRPTVVGRSSAVKPGHPALTLAEGHGVRTLRRGELLAEAVAGRRFVAVCGSHGKTTTCGLLVAALASAAFERLKVPATGRLNWPAGKRPPSATTDEAWPPCTSRQE